MNTLKLGSKGNYVAQLQSMLNMLGYHVAEDGDFGQGTHFAVLDFQSRHGLVIDGIVGVNTWHFIQREAAEAMEVIQQKALTEFDMIAAASKLGIELNVLKAVSAVESQGQGFLHNGKPVILFEGHIFWRLIKKNGQNPRNFVAGNANVLYPRWVKKHYVGGMGEHTRMDKARAIRGINDAEELALGSASWGLFQILGMHAAALGYDSVVAFKEAMYENEGQQLDAFVRFVEVNGLTQYLKNKDWTGFAKRYNGPSYKANKYDIKMEKEYERLQQLSENARGIPLDDDDMPSNAANQARPMGVDAEWF